MGNIPRFISDDGSDEDESDEDDDDYSSSDSEDGAWDFEVHIGWRFLKRKMTGKEDVSFSRFPFLRGLLLYQFLLYAIIFKSL